MAKKSGKRTERLKVNVTPDEKTLLANKAQTSGQSLSDFMREAALGRRASVSPERMLDGIWVLELVCQHIEALAEMTVAEEPEASLILVKLRRIEQMILRLAPVNFASGDGSC